MRVLPGLLGQGGSWRTQWKVLCFPHTFYMNFTVSPEPCIAQNRNLSPLIETAEWAKPPLLLLIGQYQAYDISHHKWSYAMNSSVPAQPALNPRKAMPSAPLLRLNPSIQQFLGLSLHFHSSSPLPCHAFLS